MRIIFNACVYLPFFFFLQTAEQERHLTQTNMKIDTEVAGLKTMLESHKLDTIKYLAGRTLVHFHYIKSGIIAMRK